MRLFWWRTSEDEEIPLGDDVIEWGDLPLHESEAVNHFLAVAGTGSGKTIIFRLLLQRVLPHIRRGRDARMLIYDAKQDALPLLYGICPDAEILPLNPFDERGVAWDIGADVKEPRVAVEIAFTIMPADQESQPFFSNAARHLAAGVMVSFILSGSAWSFADLVRVLKSERVLRTVLKKHPETRDLIAQYFSDARLGADIMSTVATKMLPFEPIAAAWDHAEKSVSLHEWAKQAWILILPNGEISRTAIDAINRCIFRRATDITLNQSESHTRRNWFFIDEVAEAGRLEALVPLLKKGRSKGGCVAIAFQSICGLRDQKMYGPFLTDDLLGQIGNRFIGRLECSETAEWASKLIGDQEVEGVSRTTSDAGGHQTFSETVKNEIRRGVLPAEFMNIPPCNRENGLNGLFMVPSIPPFFGKLDGDELFDSRLLPEADIPGFVPRPISCQFLRPWSMEDNERFGLTLENKRKPTKAQEPQILPEELDNLFG